MNIHQQWIKWLLPPSIIGGLIGGLLVVGFPDQFSRLVPWLIFTAAMLFVLQPQIAKWTGVGKPHEHPTGRTLAAIVAFQFFVAVYGGYFGAGIGILMLSSLGLMGLADIHVMNGLKNCLAFAINFMAMLVFITRGQIDWNLAAPMIAASIVGGFLGSTLAQKIDRQVVRLDCRGDWLLARQLLLLAAVCNVTNGRKPRDAVPGLSVCIHIFRRFAYRTASFSIL